jgi:isopenicillin-N N-acyltransferase-like protein
MSDNKGKRKLKVVEVSGDPYEMGFQYGTVCPEIRKMLDITCQVFGGLDMVIELAKKYIPMYLPAAEVYAPEIVEEMKGMAAGTQLDFQDIFFLNITYEISVPSVMGCTSFALTGEATGNCETIAGQNFDYLSMWEDSMILLKMRPAHGPDILALAPAGSLGLIGLNSAGISLNLNLLRNKDSLTPNGGVPAHIILRKVLTSETISKAIGIIASAGRRSAKNYLLASDQGDIVDLEVTLDDIDIHYAEEGILAHANHFKTTRFRSTDLAPEYWPDSYIRCQRLFQLMKNHRGRLSVDVMKQLLQDHNNHPNSICRHPDPRNPLPMGRMIKTLVSLINCPKERKAHIALGNPCENEFIEYYL